MRDYGKVYSTFWSSETTSAMSDDSKLLALYLMSCSHSTIAGVFRLPDGYVGEDLRWSFERVSKGFVELFQKGFANRCETTKWVWILKHLEWNKPENPNQRKAAAKIAASIPNACAWKLDFVRVCGELLQVSESSESNPSETLPKPFRNQKQKQKQKQKQEQEQELEPNGSVASQSLATPPSADPPNCPVEHVVQLYHELLPELPRVKLLTETRKTAVRKRWRWILSSKKPDGSRRATSTDEGLGWLRQYFAKARENDFLMGRAKRSAGHENWQCDLDFLLSEKGLKQVIEKTGDNA
jgi:hypothetical protein